MIVRKDLRYPKALNYPDGTFITVKDPDEENRIRSLHLDSAKDFSIDVWRIQRSTK
jgi:hypothetical protein